MIINYYSKMDSNSKEIIELQGELKLRNKISNLQDQLLDTQDQVLKLLHEKCEDMEKIGGLEQENKKYIQEIKALKKLKK